MSDENNGLYVNKVIYNDESIIDITDSTVTENSLMSGAKAYGANGQPIYGIVIQVTPGDNLPLVDGIASAGSSIYLSREDHVHPAYPTVNSSADGLMSSADYQKLAAFSSASNYALLSAVPSNTSDLNNDSGFLTINTLPDFYGTCNTSTNTDTKQITISNFPTTLVAGQRIYIKFDNQCSAVNYVTSFVINGTFTNSVTGVIGMWKAGEIVGFIFDGTYWHIINETVADQTHYGKTILTNSTNTNSNTMAASAAGLKTVYDAIPSQISELNNDSGFVDASGAASAAPVQSVNSYTGDVVLAIPSIAYGSALPSTGTLGDIFLLKRS